MSGSLLDEDEPLLDTFKELQCGPYRHTPFDGEKMTGIRTNAPPLTQSHTLPSASNHTENSTLSMDSNMDGLVCAGRIDWNILTASMPATEFQLRSIITSPIFQNVSLLSPGCSESWLSYLCATSYPACGKPVRIHDDYTDGDDRSLGSLETLDEPMINYYQGILHLAEPCESVCTSFVDSCAAILSTKDPGSLPSAPCNSYSSLPFPSTLDCYKYSTKSSSIDHNSKSVSLQPQPSTRASCPAPLIPKPPSFKINYTNYGSLTPSVEPVYSCIEGLDCCLPCIAASALYNPNELTNSMRIMFPINLLSFSLAFVLFLSYLILPGMRKHPKIMICFISGCLAFWQLLRMMPFFLGPEKVFCAKASGLNEIDSEQYHSFSVAATQDTNWICAFQGAGLIFTSIGTLTWVLALVINLHLQTVWQSEILSRYPYALHIICWGYPFILMTLSLVTNSIRYHFGSYCLLSLHKANSFFFYPIACILIPSIIVHLATSIWITAACRKSALKKRRDKEMDAKMPMKDGKTMHTVVHQENEVHSNSSTGTGSLRDTVVTQGLSERVKLNDVRGIEMEWSDYESDEPEVELVGVFSVQARIIVLVVGVIGIYLAVWAFNDISVTALMRGIMPAYDPEPQIERTTIFETWLTCILTSKSDNAQGECHNLISQSLPSFSFLFICESMLALGGIVSFFIFFNQNMLREWRKIFHPGNQ